MKKAFTWFIVLLSLGMILASFQVGYLHGIPYRLSGAMGGVVVIVLDIVLIVAHQPYLQHDNMHFSRVIWEDKQLSLGRSKMTEEQAKKLEEKVLAVGRRKPALAVLSFRYAGDFQFARGNSREAETHYRKAFEAAEPGSEQSLYSRHRIALCHLRMRFDEKALQEFEELSKISGFYAVGYANMIEFGWGTKPDPKKARELFETCIQAGNTGAYANSWEVQWFLENGAPGNAWADFSQYMRCCHDGRGVRAGVYALKQAASAGYVPAQFELSTVYLDGLAGENRQQRIQDGVAWLRKAAAADYPPALYNLGLHTQRLCLDPQTGTPAKPVIPGTSFYKNEVRFACYHAGMDLIYKAALAGYPPAIEVARNNPR